MNKQTKRNKTKRQRNTTKRQRNTTKRQRNTTKRQRNTTKRQRNTTKRRNLSEFIPGNKGKGLFSIPEKQQSFKIIVDNNNHKQFGNIIPGLREM
jgi:hypothetical protein